MTHRKELEALQDKARKAGRTVTFFLSGEGYIDAVFYLDPKGPGRQKSGMILDPISFAERERPKPHWYDEPTRLEKILNPKRRYFVA